MSKFVDQMFSYKKAESLSLINFLSLQWLLNYVVTHTNCLKQLAFILSRSLWPSWIIVIDHLIIVITFFLKNKPAPDLHICSIWTQEINKIRPLPKSESCEGSTTAGQDEGYPRDMSESCALNNPETAILRGAFFSTNAPGLSSHFRNRTYYWIMCRSYSLQATW